MPITFSDRPGEDFLKTLLVQTASNVFVTIRIVPIAEGTCKAIDTVMVGKSPDGGMAVFKLWGVAQRYNDVVTVVSTTLEAKKMPESLTWDVTLEADGTSLLCRVKGAINTVVDWKCWASTYEF